MAKEYKFDIYFPGDMSAGLWSYSDVVAVTVDSGNPGGEEGEFEQWLVEFLGEWFDGATITPSNARANGQPPEATG